MTRRLHTIVVVALCVIGLADSAYLTWDHFSHLAEAGYQGGLCGVGGGCELSRTSSLSEIPMPGANPGFPIALAGFAFYIAYLVLQWRFARSVTANTTSDAVRLDVRPVHALQIFLAFASVAYAIFLGAWSLSQGSLCPFCTVLYGVNMALLVLALLAGRLYPGALGGFGGFFAGFGRALPGRPALFAFLAFGATAAPGYVVYRAALVSALTPPPASATPQPPAVATGSPARSFDVADRPSKGPADATLHVVEFADFECPHCQAAFEHLAKLTAALPDDLRVTYLHFPLDSACNKLMKKNMHPRACSLARMAECAHRQGRFVDAARIIFEQQKQTDDAGIIAAIAGLGLDRAALDTCLQDEGSAKAVRSDIDRGIEAGVRGTPTLFLNGQEVKGGLNVESLKAMLQKSESTPTPETKP